MSEPFFAVKVGSWDCFCVLKDEEETLRQERAEELQALNLGATVLPRGADVGGHGGGSDARAAGIAVGRGPSLESGSSVEDPLLGRHRGERYWPARNLPEGRGQDAGKRADDANPLMRSREQGDTRRQTWKPHLPRLASADSSADAEEESHTLLHDWRDLPFAPVPRRRAGRDRRRARDTWNFEELRLGDTLAKGGYSCAEGLDDRDFRAALEACWGDQLAEDDLYWMRLMATRGEGDRPISLQELHYALRAWHGLGSLPKESLRKMALIDLAKWTAQDNGDIDTKLVEVMEDLNGGLTVMLNEAKLVLEEAAGISDGLMGRPQLLRAIGAWYTNVQRKDTTLFSLFRLYSGRAAGASEYHLEVLYQLAKFAPDKEVVQGNQREPAPSISKSFTSEVATVAVEKSRAPLEHVLRVISAVIAAAVLLLALVFPTVFFGYVVYVGAMHGSSVCVRDIDGLLTWFGVLGLTALAMDCAEGTVVPDRHRVKDGSGAFGPWGCTSLILRLVLLIFPWVGTAWTFYLTQAQQVVCGMYLWVTSACLWPLLLLLELLVAFRFFWGLAVLAEHEISLRQVLAAPEPAARTPTCTERRKKWKVLGGTSPGGSPASRLELSQKSLLQTQEDRKSGNERKKAGSTRRPQVTFAESEPA